MCARFSALTGNLDQDFAKSLSNGGLSALFTACVNLVGWEACQHKQIAQARQEADVLASVSWYFTLILCTDAAFMLNDTPHMGGTNLWNFLKHGFQLTLKPAVCDAPIGNLTSSLLLMHPVQRQPMQKCAASGQISGASLFCNTNFDLDRAQTPRWLEIKFLQCHTLSVLTSFPVFRPGADEQVAFYAPGFASSFCSFTHTPSQFFPPQRSESESDEQVSLPTCGCISTGLTIGQGPHLKPSFNSVGDCKTHLYPSSSNPNFEHVR